MTNRNEVTPAQRAEAVELAAKVGAAEAARRLGLPPANIRQWTKRMGDATASAVARFAPGIVTSTPGNRWVDRRPVVADAAAMAADEALTALRSAIVKGDDRAAKNYSVTFGVLVDKVQLITGAATTRTESATVSVTYRASGDPAEMQQRIAELRAELGIALPSAPTSPALSPAVIDVGEVRQ